METVLITGASSGLGLSHAIYLVNLGYNVIGTTRNVAKLDLDALKLRYQRDHTKYEFLDKAKTKIKPKKSLIPSQIFKNLPELLNKIQFFELDITKDESVSSCIEGIIKWCEEKSINIDVLVNNAGNGFFGSIEDLSIDNVKIQFETNYFGYIRMIQAILPYFRKQNKGKIINTASLAGLIGIPFQSHYCASKAAIMRMSESLQMELREFNISVCTILPGDINTNFNANTAKLTKDNSNLDSIDIDKLLMDIPVSKKSVYKTKADNVWKQIVQNLIVAPPPIVVSKVLLKIIKKNNPKIHNMAGSMTQKTQMVLLRRILSNRFGINGSASFYDID
jgi:short-subunit dehydrogenase